MPGALVPHHYYSNLSRRLCYEKVCYRFSACTEINNEIYFAVAIKPNNSTAIVVDGYGHYAKRDTQITPHISISSSGVDMTITPEQNVSYMPSTHVQVDR